MSFALSLTVVRVLWVSMRTVVSYDDIVTPQNNASAQIGPPLPSATQPPAKKRRTSHQKAQNRPSAQQQIQHWDDPGDDADVMHYGGDPSGVADAMDYAEEEDESRELTHEEVWDDSALIDAWNSAAAEYEVSRTLSPFLLLTVAL